MNGYEWVYDDKVVVVSAESVDSAREIAMAIPFENVKAFVLSSEPDDFPDAGWTPDDETPPVYVLDEITNLEIWPENGKLY